MPEGTEIQFSLTEGPVNFSVMSNTGLWSHSCGKNVSSQSWCTIANALRAGNPLTHVSGKK